jgi:hypothetical protein
LSPYSPVQDFHLDMGISSDINWYRLVSTDIGWYSAKFDFCIAHEISKYAQTMNIERYRQVLTGTSGSRRNFNICMAVRRPRRVDPLRSSIC